MKKFLLSAAAALAIAAPGVAAADSGDVGVSFSNTDAGGGFDFDTWSLNGGYVHNLDGNMILQFDGEHNKLDAGGGSDLGVGYGAVNYGVRNDSYSFYGFVGLSDIFAVSATNYGIGGQYYLSNMTFNASYGMSDWDGGLDMTNIHIDGTYFFTDNFGISAEAGQTDIDFTDWRTLGVGAVWRPTGSNFTIDAGYRNFDFDGAEADQFRIGFTYNIGSGSARENSQSGASLNGARTLFEETSNLILFP
ncbi:MAG: hypothetical protein IPL62_02530 [Caulobacteraceae bacterium]|nr:hypothetical protein [Caulobacteraceae bacterium]MBK8542528.1 hypothetical protein [Caulobacteraceae bacterium]